MVSDFAALLPATVIATMLGIPLDQHDNVRVWTDQFLTRDAGVMGIPPRATRCRQPELVACRCSS